MRRVISSLLLGLLLYNMTGYSIAFLLEQRGSIKAEAHFIGQIESSKDIVIKVPVAVPYQTSWEAPEAAEGEFEHDGQFYTMVTRQLVNDTLYVSCTYDQNARDRFTALASKVSDQLTPESGQRERDEPSKILKNFMHDYMSRNRKHVFYIFEWVGETAVAQNERFIFLPGYLSIPSPPPDIV